ncbi:MAG: 5-formyltetrahydrofolate cyclo-ligase [Campylobacter sp.]|nr:5-formyltetrahydrofolate cyclo-ligase [Campylobacter sp.]
MKKDKFRKFAKFELKKERVKFAKSKHYKIFNAIEDIARKTHSKNIMAFLPLGYEPNTLYFFNKFRKKYSFYVPFMLNISFKLVKLRRPFLRAKFNVLQTPNQNAFDGKIDLAIIPVVGVSKDGGRIGHGKGYYDMFFSKLKYRPVMVFVEIKEMIDKKLISQSHDIKGDFYITPNKNYILRGKNVRNFHRTVCGSCGGRYRLYSQ